MYATVIILLFLMVIDNIHTLSSLIVCTCIKFQEIQRGDAPKALSVHLSASEKPLKAKSEVTK